METTTVPNFPQFRRRARVWPLAALAILAAGCSDNNDSPAEGDDAVPFQELIDQGVTRYLGLYSPMMSTEDGGVMNHAFGEGDGPLCLDGGPYTMATRDTGTEDLMIFLQGGGACWFDLCAATSEAAPGIPNAGILNPSLGANPLAGMSTVYLPYCDGGLFASDADVDSDDDGTPDRFHRGLHNLSAALDVAVQTFPAPRRIVLAGVSGGGYGSIFALPLVRQLYPDVPIDVLNDSGVGITRPDDPAFNQQIIDYWNINGFFPASCEECTIQGDPSGFLDWQLKQDPDTRLGMLSYAQDFTIGTFFLGIGGPAFEGVLRPAMAELESRNPERMRSFIAPGSSHTFLLGELDVAVEGVTVGEWVESMVDDVDGNWESVSE
tara:strand:- start:2517 stop:3653 length:1137 start_codon:yes stop_codon:yes gene_type:complete